jgi:hypothetical protein
MNTREDMDAALKKLVVPALRQRGFTGSFPHFRRIAEEVDLLTFQFDRNGGGFVVEAAKGKKEGFTTHWGKHIPAAKLTAWDLHPNQRRRLRRGSDGSTDSWFRYDAKETCESVALKALALILKEDEPNKAPEPTSGIVTSSAEPGAAPIPTVAHL